MTGGGMVVDTDRVTFARLQRAPERLLFGEADVAQRQTHLADRIVPGEAIIVKYLHVQRPAHQLVVRKTCNDNNDSNIATVGTATDSSRATYVSTMSRGRFQ